MPELRCSSAGSPAVTNPNRVKPQPTEQCQSGDLGDHHNLPYPVALYCCHRWARADLPQYGLSRTFPERLILETER